MLDMDKTGYEPPMALPLVCDVVPEPVTYRGAVINTLVHVHKTAQKLNDQVRRIEKDYRFRRN